MIEPVILTAALILDALIGDPPTWPHFVRFMGSAISAFEQNFRLKRPTAAEQQLAGLALVGLIAGGSWLVAWSFMFVTHNIWAPLGWIMACILAFQSIAAGQLWREARRVAAPLDRGDIELARIRLAMIVGRDTAELDDAGIRRAIIETVAENLNDGVVAPLFYLALGGPALSVAYKAVNTLDSMVGYKNERYIHYGRAAAKLDDIIGWIPARLSALLIVATAAMTGMNAKGAWLSCLANHSDHSSPNAGWPEAAAAGALGLRLGGPGVYSGVLVPKPWINSAGRNAGKGDVNAVTRLLVGATLLASLAAVFSAWCLPFNWF